MIYLNDIPYMKTFKKKVSLPKDKSSMLKYNMVLLNSTSTSDVIKLFSNHPIINKPNNYTIYYIPNRYKEYISTKNVVLNYTQERKKIYSDISDAKIGLTPIMNTDLANSRNMVYDLFVYNNIYTDNYKKRGSIKDNISSYISYLASKLITLEGYRYKMLLMDIDSWFSNATKLNTSAKGILGNPILMISYALYRFPDMLDVLGDIDIYFYSSTGIFRFNPSMIDDKSYGTYKRELNKLLTKITLDDVESVNDEDDGEPENNEPEEDKAPTGRATTVNKRGEEAKDEYGDNSDDEKLVTDDDNNDTEEDISDGMDMDINDEEDVPKTDDTIEDEYAEIVNTMTDIRHARRETRSEASIARNKELKKRQDDIVVRDKTIKEQTVYHKEDYIIPEYDLEGKVKTTNENLKVIKFANFDKSYNENIMTKDTINIITHMNNLTVPTYVKSIDIKDTSTNIDYKETYTIVLEDENRVRHTLKFDMPKFIDNSFMYIGGNKKIINKQLFMKPIVKTGPNEVQICSNYNKIFLSRIGRKMSSELEKFKKAISNDIKGVKVIYGNNLKINSSYKTILEYDELAQVYYSIKVNDIEILFNQKDIETRLDGKTLPDSVFCVGFYKDGTPILMDFKTERIGELGLISFILSHIGEEGMNIYDETSAGASKFMYSSAKIMNKPVPVILLLGYCEGLSMVMKKAKIKYHFTDKRPKLDNNEASVQFADGYLVYKKDPFENALLMNALSYIPTKAYNYADFDEIDAYIDLFDSLYNSRQLANAFDSFYEFMIDPITKEVLNDLGYPTDFVSVVLCGNAMLADNSYLVENDMNLYRIRSNEVVNAILYKEIAKAYSRYRATSANNTPVKISIPQNAVISSLMKLTTVEDYSTLNPLYEATKTHIASPKGASGMNLDEAYTLERRYYDKSMVGIIGTSSSPDGNVGVTRHLTLEPSVVSARGYVDIKSTDELTDANLFTPSELLTPGCMGHDDSPRVAMASKQSTHMVPIDRSSPVLISNGSEQILQYHLSSDFVIVADEDGEVIERDDKIGIIIVKYKSGKTRAIDINSRIGKNAASGFYISSKLESKYQVGDKFKARDILAYENKFFSDDPINGNRMNIGSLQKVAIMSAYSTFEDSSFITKKISNDMATDVIMMKDISIGKNADVDHIVKIGDSIEVGDPLVSFSTSYEDARMNEFLRSMSEDQAEDIKDLSRIQLKSKYGGVIEDIRIYSSCDLNELSPSLQKIVSAHYNRINKKVNMLNKYDKSSDAVKCGVLVNEPTTKVPLSADGKIKGHDVDGILIEFYVKFHDVVGVGDKITYFSALKSVCCEIVNEGYEPFSEFRPNEEVSAFVPPLSIIGRMVPSTIQTILANKVLVELKRKLKDIYDA
jgi:hypothetical protein